MNRLILSVLLIFAGTMWSDRAAATCTLELDGFFCTDAESALAGANQYGSGAARGQEWCDTYLPGTTHLIQPAQGPFFNRLPGWDSYVGIDGCYPLGLIDNSQYTNWYFPSGTYSPPFSAERNKGPCPTDSCFGDPINAGTGNKFEVKTEFLGTGQFPLEFTWTYNSSGGPIVDSSFDKILGANRTHTYQRRIRVSTIGTESEASITRPDGNTFYFTRMGIGWVAESALDGFLTATYSGADGPITSWSYRNANNEIEVYDAAGKLVSIVNGVGVTQTLSYDASQRLATVRDPSGRQLSFVYNANDRLSQLTMPDGQVLNFAYDLNDNLETVAYPGGTNATYIYNEQSHTSNTALPNSLTGELDANGVRYSTTKYDTAGRATGTYLASNVDRYDAVYTNSPDGMYISTASIRSPLGKTRTLQLRPVNLNGGRVVSTSYVDRCAGCVSNSRSFTYDGQGRPDLVTDSLNVVTDTDYDNNGLLTRVTRAKGTPQQQVVETVWDTYFRVPLNIDRPGQRQTFTYNTRGQQLTTTVTDMATDISRTTTNTYCEQSAVDQGTCPVVGLQLTVNGPRIDVSDVTTFSYYQTDDPTCITAPTTCPHRKGDLWKVTNALNQTSEYISYDGAGRALSMKDANDVVSDMEYNTRGWLIARKVRGANPSSESDDVITRMEYDATGLVTKLTQADGDFINFSYDAAHRLTGISDALNNSIVYTLDNAGNRTAETTQDPGGNLKRNLSRVYDTLGRLQVSKNASNVAVATLAYDVNHNLDTSMDGLGRVTDQDFDPLNRLAKSIQDKGVGRINATTQFEYDARDNLTRVVDPKSLNTVYTYDGFNDLLTLSSPDTGVTVYTYDNAGNRKTQRDAKLATTTYSYDVLNRLTLVSYTTTSLNSTSTYDTVNTICGVHENFAKGRLTRIADASGNTQYCYDRFGNLTRKQVTNNGVVSTLLFSYTKAGRISSITYPSGMVVNYTRNALGQTTQVGVTQSGITKTLVDNVDYLPFGPIKQLSFPVPVGGTATSPFTQTRNYDADYAIDSIGGLDYSVDVLGNITNIADPGGSNGFVYDSMDRLKQVTNTSGANVSTFTYDATGNRLSKTVGATSAATYVYPTTSHRLTQVGSVARTLDANGNSTKTASNKFFTYDARNRMVDFRSGSASSKIVSQYQYNGKGERVRKYKGTVDQARYLYGEGGQLLVQTKIVSGVTTTQEMIWLDDMPVGISQNGNLHGVLADHLNTPRQVFELATQKKVWAWSSVNDAFGENLAMEDPDANGVKFVLDMRFPGQLYDAESGLHYNRYRDFEAGTGRYTQSDPTGLDGGASTFTYVDSNSLRFFDKKGLQKGVGRHRSSDPNLNRQNRAIQSPSVRQRNFDNLESARRMIGQFPSHSAEEVRSFWDKAYAEAKAQENSPMRRPGCGYSCVICIYFVEIISGPAPQSASVNCHGASGVGPIANEYSNQLPNGEICSTVIFARPDSDKICDGGCE